MTGRYSYKTAKRARVTAKRAEAHAAGTARPVRLWSPYRPERPETDELFIEILQLLERDTRSVWQKANASGLSTSTISNWQKHKVKRPNGVSLQMAAAMLGRKIRLD